MRKLRAVLSLLRQWRRLCRRDDRRSGYLVGALLILLVFVVKWPKTPPRIEPFIYAHF